MVPERTLANKTLVQCTRTNYIEADRQIVDGCKEAIRQSREILGRMEQEAWTRKKQNLCDYVPYPR